MQLRFTHYQKLFQVFGTHSSTSEIGAAEWNGIVHHWLSSFVLGTVRSFVRGCAFCDMRNIKLPLARQDPLPCGRKLSSENLHFA